MLTRSGRIWERHIQDQLDQTGLTVLSCDKRDDYRPHVRRLTPGRTICLLQASVTGSIGEWSMERVFPGLIHVARDDNGELTILIADLKATRAVRLEHRLQIAAYAMLIRTDFPDATIRQAVPTVPPGKVAGESPMSEFPDFDAFERYFLERVR